MEEKYPELGNLMPRDVTAREIWYHCQAGETVWLDLTGLEEDIFFRKLSGLVADCLLYGGVDIRCQPIAVAPGIHYFMGGLYVDEWHRTPWKHLYAAGECACQYHGANRLGGNSLLGAIYGGRKAACTAIEEGNGRCPGRASLSCRRQRCRRPGWPVCGSTWTGLWASSAAGRYWPRP